MRNAVTDNAVLSVLRYGATDFTTDGSFNGATQTQVALNPGTQPPAGVQLSHVKVVAGDFVEMTAPEKAAVDAAEAASIAANLPTATVLFEVANTAALPLPPPAAGLMVMVADVGGGSPALAISQAARWAIINVDSFVGP